MAETNENKLRLCPTCGGALAESGEPCPTCVAPSGSVDPNPYAVSGKYARPIGPTFHLSTLLLTITLIAVCLGLATWLPGVAIGVAILLVPAYVRTALAGLRLKRAGLPPTLSEKLVIFFASVGIVTSIAAASGIAFYATCWAGYLGGATISEAAGAPHYDPIFHGLIAGVIVGGVAGIVALYFVARWLWPYRDFAARHHQGEM